jgi:hypothetical protein
MKLLIDTNEYPADQAYRSEELKCNGVWSVPINSPGITVGDTAAIIHGIGSGIVVTEEGGLDVYQLLEDPNWTGGPRKINQQRTLTRASGFNPSRAMVYYEFSAPNQRHTCLTPHELSRAYVLEEKTPLLPMTRNWDRNYRARMKEALTLPKNVVAGVCFELEANVPLIKSQSILGGIKYVAGIGREVWILLSPQGPSIKYEKDVEDVLKYLKRNLSASVWASIYVVLAVYEIENKGTSFFGLSNSMLAAIKVARGYR